MCDNISRYLANMFAKFSHILDVLTKIRLVTFRVFFLQECIHFAFVFAHISKKISTESSIQFNFISFFKLEFILSLKKCSIIWKPLTGKTGTTSMCELRKMLLRDGSCPSHVTITMVRPELTWQIKIHVNKGPIFIFCLIVSTCFHNINWNFHTLSESDHNTPSPLPMSVLFQYTKLKLPSTKTNKQTNKNIPLQKKKYNSIKKNRKWKINTKWTKQN